MNAKRINIKDQNNAGVGGASIANNTSIGINTRSNIGFGAKSSMEGGVGNVKLPSINAK